MADQRQPATPLVVEIDQRPRCAGPVRGSETLDSPSVAGISSTNHVRAHSDTADTPSNSDPEAMQSSPALQATQNGVYAVVLENADETRPIQIGTAWAASDRYLVTTATVAMSVKEHQKRGGIASILIPGSAPTIRIETARVHDTYRQAAEAADDANEKRNEKRFAMAQATQLRFNLGVLDVGQSECLEAPLPLFSKSLKNSKETVFVMVGVPFPNQEDELSDSVEVGPLKELSSKKLAAKVAPQSKDQALAIQFTSNADRQNWSGSPVLNKENKVIGVYAELPQPKSKSRKSNCSHK